MRVAPGFLTTDSVNSHERTQCEHLSTFDSSALGRIYIGSQSDNRSAAPCALETDQTTTAALQSTTMTSRLRRTWNRLLRRHPPQRLLTPQPGEIKSFFPGRDSLAIHTREDQRRRPVTAMARYGTPETPIGARSITLSAQPSPDSYVSNGSSTTSTRLLVSNAVHQAAAAASGSPSRGRRSNVPSPETPAHMGQSTLPTNSPNLCEPGVPTAAEYAGSDHSIALTTATSSNESSRSASEDATPTTSPIHGGRESPSIFTDEKIPVMAEPVAMVGSCPSPVMQATSGPLQDYYVYYNP